MGNVLRRDRLLALLSEYHEYPSQYRQIIWQTLLKLPINTEAYSDLIIKGEHQTAKQICIDPITPEAKNLIKIITYLMHWSSILDFSKNELSEFLIDFIMPFVKTLSNQMIVCFETIATILLNQCQLWFEYSPLAPLNYLGLVENLLEHFQPNLLQFYKMHNITNLIYAWHPLKSGFSHQLDEWQWLQLWDHIISKPSYYLVFVIVAFNTVQCKSIERLSNAQQIFLFFQEKSAINMKMWLNKIDQLIKNCPIAIHPCQYMHNFIGLSDANNNQQYIQYEKLLNYPQQLFVRQTRRCTKFAAETMAINRKYMELERFEMKLMQQLVDNVCVDEQKRRMQQIEIAHQQALLNDVQRVEAQKQHLILYERQLNDRLALMTTQFVESELENECVEREHRLKMTVNNVEQQVCNILGIA